MLHLWLHEPADESHYVYSANMIFDAEYESEWLEEGVIRDMIADVDKSEVISGELIMSPVFGPMSPDKLSGGVKTLIMAYNDNSRMYNLTSCGDNCAKWVLALTKDKDITMRLAYLMDFGNVADFKVHILNTDTVVTSYNDFISEFVRSMPDDR